MFLDYLSLLILLIGLTLVFYGFIYIHDLPHTVAKKRHHPHEEAIHVACWLSLFTLHAIWPIVYIWAVTHKKPGHAGAKGGTVAEVFAGPAAETGAVTAAGTVTTDVDARLARLEQLLTTAGTPGPAGRSAKSTPAGGQK